MRLRLGRAVLTSLFVIYGAVAQTPPVTTNDAINGVWRGQINGFSAIILVVTDEPGSLTGAIQFYFQKRTTEKDPWTAEPGLPEPIFHPRFDGKTLLFEVSHRRAHPPESLKDPPKRFRVTLNGPDTAEIVNVDESGSPTLKLVRSSH
jgi:hypothetical protein